MSTRYIWDDETAQWVPLAARRPARHAPTVHLIRDEMDSTVNHADGRRYTSKRKFEAEVRAHGCTIIGNEKTDHIKPPPSHAPGEVASDILRTMAQLRSR